jgi:Right handed beta helix region
VIAMNQLWPAAPLALTASVLCGSGASAAPATPLTLYVSPVGRDGWSGRLPAPNRPRTDGPFATIRRALDAVRDVRAAAGPPRAISLLIREGRYEISQPLVVTPAHSGTAECPTTIAAYHGERPVISGGRAISGWQLGSDGLWQVDLPEVKAGRWYFRDLYVNGQRRPRPRVPKEGAYAIAAAGSPDTSAFQYAPGHIDPTWSNRSDLEVVVLQYWMAARLHIASIDEAARMVRFTGGSWRPLVWSMGYFVENVAEALTQPGEWYLDRPAGRLRYNPRPEERLAETEAIAPVAEQLVRFEGDPGRRSFVQHVTLRGLRFAHCAWPLPAAGLAYPQGELPVGAAIGAVGARQCAIEDCEIADCDSGGIELGRACQDNRVTGNQLHDLGGGGIKLGEVEYPADDEDEACRTLIADNVLRDGAQTYFGSPGIWVGQSSGNEVSHNEVQGSWQFGISVGWRWAYFPPQRARDNVIEWNRLDHVGGALGSHSSIYTLGIQPGTVIRNNVVHHGAGYAIALDQSSTGVLVENNLAYRNAAGLHFNWDCLGDIVRNNVFAFNGPAQWTRYGDAPQQEDMNCNVLERNIVCWRDGRLWVEPKWPNYRMALDINLYYDYSGQPVTFLGFPLEEWRTKGPWLDRNSVVADPRFLDPDHDDYRLQPDSPALGLGFHPFDLGAAGPRAPGRSSEASGEGRG